MRLVTYTSNKKQIFLGKSATSKSVISKIAAKSLLIRINESYESWNPIKDCCDIAKCIPNKNILIVKRHIVLRKWLWRRACLNKVQWWLFSRHLVASFSKIFIIENNAYWTQQDVFKGYKNRVTTKILLWYWIIKF